MSKQKKRGPVKTDVLLARLQNNIQGKVAEPVAIIRFPDGTVHRVTEKLWREVEHNVNRRVRYRIRGPKDGSKGGRPKTQGKPIDSELLRTFLAMRERSNDLSARFRYIRALSRDHRVTMKTARSWLDGALGKVRPKQKGK